MERLRVPEICGRPLFPSLQKTSGIQIANVPDSGLLDNAIVTAIQNTMRCPRNVCSSPFVSVRADFGASTFHHRGSSPFVCRASRMRSLHWHSTHWAFHLTCGHFDSVWRGMFGALLTHFLWNLLLTCCRAAENTP